VPAGPRDGRRERAPHRTPGGRARGARQRLALLRGDHLRGRGLLRTPRGRPRTGHRLRHPLPSRRAGGPAPARHRPHPRRRGPHAGPAPLAGGHLLGDLRLPGLGDGLTEAPLVSWHVAVGDEATLNQALAEAETAKALVELPSPRAGRIRALHAEEGETLAVGAPLVGFEESAAPEAGTGQDDPADGHPADEAATAPS